MTPETQTPWWREPSRLVLIGFLAIAGFFLVTEHTAHVFGVLPWLLLCITVTAGMAEETRGTSTGAEAEMHDYPQYGLWSLAIINSVIFIGFAFTFFKPQTKRDWRSFSAFLVALFAEMYGFPLTIYLLSGRLQSRFPHVN